MVPLKSVIRHRPPQPIVFTSTPFDVVGLPPGSAAIAISASQVPTSIFRIACSGPGLGAGGGGGGFCAPPCAPAAAAAASTVNSTTGARNDDAFIILLLIAPALYRASRSDRASKPFLQ